MFALAFVIFFCVIKNEKITGNYLIIFLAFFPPFIIYYSLLLSEYLDSKYIIIGLILIGAEILSFLFNIFLEKFEIKYFILFSGVLSFIPLLFISIFWLKSWFPILYVSIFWLVSNIIHLSFNFAIKKLTKLEEEESFLSILLLNYSIFLLLLYPFFLGIIIMIESDNILSKSTCIYLCQNILIIIFVWIGFSFDWNKVIKIGHYNGWIIAVNVVFLLIPSIHYLFLFDSPDNDCALLEIIYNILYIPLMIIFYYLFSTIINEKYILCFIFIIFIELFLILIFMIFADSSNYWIIATISILSGVISSILFHFCWFHNTKAFTWIIIFSILIGIYLTIILSLIEYFYKDRGTVIDSLMALNYSLFSLAIVAVYFIFYGLFLFFKCICEICNKS